MFQVAFSLVLAWVESRLAKRPFFVHWPAWGGFTHVHIGLCLLIPSKRKAGKKDPTLHNMIQMGKRQSRAFTKNSDVQYGGQTASSRLQVPKELWRFRFLFYHLSPTSKRVAFGFLQPAQLPCTEPSFNSILSALRVGELTLRWYSPLFTCFNFF